MWRDDFYHRNPSIHVFDLLTSVSFSRKERVGLCSLVAHLTPISVSVNPASEDSVRETITRLKGSVSQGSVDRTQRETLSRKRVRSGGVPDIPFGSCSVFPWQNKSNIFY